MSNMYSLNKIYKKIILEEDLKKDNNEAELKFSINLASEFARTINSFTDICAKMVKEKIVNKETYDKFDELYSKIKNLVDAAKNS